jgi:hypothetical protein
MTDGNTYVINKYLNELEDWDALQETYAELEQAESDNLLLLARIEELELAVRYEADLAQMALDARKELETKLTKALEAERERCAKVAESVALPMDGRNAKAQADYMSKVIASAIRAELKGETDE